MDDTKDGWKWVEQDGIRVLRGPCKPLYRADVVDTLKAENTQLKAERDIAKHALKEICDEWNEDCEESCDKVAHAEGCRSVSIAVAKRALNQENTQLREALSVAREALEAVSNARRRTVFDVLPGDLPPKTTLMIEYDNAAADLVLAAIDAVLEKESGNG